MKYRWFRANSIGSIYRVPARFEYGRPMFIIAGDTKYEMSNTAWSLRELLDRSIFTEITP